ncbi:hypothetical protein GLA29479_1239 [Lysobacter antibioticus]|nr:hypothetical protein GLA29479_1239 [Lysobacter antibioticus]
MARAATTQVPIVVGRDGRRGAIAIPVAIAVAVAVAVAVAGF